LSASHILFHHLMNFLFCCCVSLFAYFYKESLPLWTLHLLLWIASTKD
jgi:hypothetical protein